jgi:hypothetical protein
VDRPTVLMALASVALTQRCETSEALEIARRVLGDRQELPEDDLEGLLSEASRLAGQAVWGVNGEYIG